jgi:hypothetical protein
MNARAEHTPGPWRLRGGAVRSEANGWEVCRPYETDAPTGLRECSANARLIAAAPDLLAALRPLAVWAENERRMHLSHDEENEAAYMGALADAARAAIEKATGGGG